MSKRKWIETSLVDWMQAIDHLKEQGWGRGDDVKAIHNGDRLCYLAHDVKYIGTGIIPLLAQHIPHKMVRTIVGSKSGELLTATVTAFRKSTIVRLIQLVGIKHGIEALTRTIYKQVKSR